MSAADLKREHDALAEREPDHHAILHCHCDLARQWYSVATLSDVAEQQREGGAR